MYLYYANLPRMKPEGGVFPDLVGIYPCRDIIPPGKEKPMSIAASLREIIANLESELEDAEKFDNGVDLPGTRVRKATIQAGKDLKALRDTVSATRKERKSAD